LSAVLKVRLCKYDIFAESGVLSGIGMMGVKSRLKSRAKACTRDRREMLGKMEKNRGKMREKKTPGRFAEGPRHPGLIPARLRSERARKLWRFE
jgi:hypothetical protein